MKYFQGSRLYEQTASGIQRRIQRLLVLLCLFRIVLIVWPLMQDLCVWSMIDIVNFELTSRIISDLIKNYQIFQKSSVLRNFSKQY